MSNERVGGALIGAAIMTILFLLAIGLLNNVLRDEIKALKKQRLVCPMCEGKGVVPVPGVE